MSVERKELPILFTPENAAAIQKRVKTQTRRLVALDIPEDATEVFSWFPPEWPQEGEQYAPGGLWVRTPAGLFFLGPSPYGGPGDFLYVRETWQLGWDTGEGDTYSLIRPTGRTEEHARTFYRADFLDGSGPAKWRPSIFMPKARAKRWLKVTDVRVERLQDIPEADAKAEGARAIPVTGMTPEDRNLLDLPLAELDHPYRNGFAVLWDSINRDRAAWAEDPWVWVISFQLLAGRP